MKEFLIIYSIVIVVMSLIALFTYVIDKNKAKKNKWRIKESVLLGLGVLGGAIGALIAIKVFRHKTKHWYFWAVNLIALAVQVSVPVIVCFMVF